MSWVEARTPVPAFSRSDRAAETSVRIINCIFPPQDKRKFDVRLWNGQTIPGGAGKNFTLVLNDPGALREMLIPPSDLNMGEAFVRKTFEVEGDLVACVREAQGIIGRMGDRRNWWPVVSGLLSLPATSRSRIDLGEAHLTGRSHSQVRDSAAIAHHYNRQTRFYSLFLDPRMIYSCAYFPTPETRLEDAQGAKLDHTLAKVELKPGERLLDIGCGWGGLILRAASRFGVDATGITLSEPQAEYANELIEAAGLANVCRAQVLDYRGMPEDKPFDNIVSVGMHEHVGRDHLGEYFGKTYRLLKPGGTFVCHGIANNIQPDFGIGGNLLMKILSMRGNFIQNYIFPDGELVYIDELLASARKAGFEMRHSEGLREHYALTLRHWQKGLESHRDEVIKECGESTYRIWRLYFASCAAYFDANLISIFQTVLQRPDPSGKSGMALTLKHLYQ